MKVSQNDLILELKKCITHYRKFTDGEYIHHQGEYFNHLYIIHNGNISLNLDTYDGRCFQLGKIACNEHLFGEVEFFAEQPCQWNIVAEDDLEIGIVCQTKLLGLLSLRPDFGVYFIRLISRDFCESTDIYLPRIMHSISYNIAQDLLLFFENRSSLMPYDSLNQEAERFGTSYRAYRRVIKELVAKGIITVEHSKIDIADINKLKAHLKGEK